MSLFQKAAGLALRSISSKENYRPPDNEICFKRSIISSIEFFARFQNSVDFKGKTVLDVGCGRGATCFYMALNGASKVVGIDINENALAFARSQLQKHPKLRDILAFKTRDEMGTEKFDIIISKDAFEHYNDPANFIKVIAGYLKPQGQMVVGFSPLWKSPYGGHMCNFTKVPWVHILFPESILMPELRRFMKNENVKSFRHIAGGLNKMTMARYLDIVKRSGFELEFFRTNVSSDPKERSILNIFRIMCLFPPLREYFTVNLYSILRFQKYQVERR